MTEAADKPFRATIVDTFRITGRGTVVAFREPFEGTCRVGDALSVPLRDGSRRTLKVKGIEFGGGIRPDGSRSGFLGLLFGLDLDKEDLQVGEEVRAA